MKTTNLEIKTIKKEWVTPVIAEISKKVILKIAGTTDKSNGNTDGNPSNFTFKNS